MQDAANGNRSTSWVKVVLVGRNFRFTLVRIVVLAAVVWFVSSYVLMPIRVQGPSMLPTYSENGVNFVNRLSYRQIEPQRGDVIAIRFSGKHAMLMKRVVGLPGETVQFHRGRLLINGTVLPEPYLDSKAMCDWELPAETLAPDEFYVVGDNRSMPYQNHTFGKAKRYRIMGKILLCKNLFTSWGR